MNMNNTKYRVSTKSWTQYIVVKEVERIRDCISCIIKQKDGLEPRINDVFGLIVIQDIMSCHNVIPSVISSYRTSTSKHNP